VVASYDLHANVSDADIATLDAFIGYRSNPHLDMRERGAESAQILRRLLGGARMAIARVRLPIVPPTVTMLTAPEAPNRPYGELIDLGQKLMRQPPWAGRVVNVSVLGGFAYGDTPHNGLSVVVTATDRETAHGLAVEIATAGWRRRERFYPALTTLDEAVRLAKATEDRSRPALIFADVADNPGGGGRGNTMFVLSAFYAAGVRDAVVGLIHDPLLAAEAHRRGEGASFSAHFNRDPSSDFTLPLRAPATVARLHPGPVRGRRGIYAGSSMDMGPSAALLLDGITVLVASERFQCADPAFLESFGIDIAAQRVVVVKSRGHFRGGFDEFFRHDQVVEVDAPGLTSPMLHHFHWKHLPRPVVPLDAHVTWSPEGAGQA
jgi:microcystin degradation protein MlrC